VSQQEDPSPTPHGEPPRDERPIEETAVEARQGRSGPSMLWVLGISTVAAAVILLLIVLFSGVFAPTPNIGLTPKPSGPFDTQVHKEQTPAGTRDGAPAKPDQGQP
jgi:hypothetical protein